MARDIDPNLQRIIDNASLALCDEVMPEFSFPRVESRSRQRTFEESRWPFREGGNDFDGDSYSYEPFNEPVAPARTTSRLSLVPWTSQHRQDGERDMLIDAGHHFRFAQNLRRNQARENMMPNNGDPERGLDQLATNMLLQRPMLQMSPEPARMSSNAHGNRIGQLQPQIQQVTPPFNLSGFVHSPNTQRGSVLSSPSQVGNSSPTTRISLRRVSNRKPLPQRPSVGSNDANEPVRNFETPQRQRVATAASAIERTPQALNLGHAPPMAQGIPLISPHELPDRIRQVFPYELFNAVQSKCFAAVYRGNDNVIVSAPTGCGKTAVLELAICRVVESHGTGEFKIVYQAPTRSLCAERMRDWQKKFSHLNLPCAELTGDTSQYEMNRVRNASIIVTTPEKWDSITRKWHDHIKLLQMVKLFLIDEVHILKDARGATLEAVISRMKSSAANVRFIALSATVPNSEDIATWLGRDPTNTLLPAHRETFNEDFRPVKLQKHVYGFEGMMNDFAFEKVLDGKLPGLIQKHTDKKPIMVFCFTRKSCENTATILAEWWTRQKVIHRAWPAPRERTAVINKELQELVGCGVAFHHAGLDVQDRGAIEKAFLKGDISVICCTSTLAVGVNLPCHLVVLKGTVGFQDGGLGEYSDLEVMQMLGRAGRPQFDDTAVAIIMTRQDMVSRYKMMVSGQEILESTLHLNLIEHLNSEIGLGTVYSLETARKWLSGTFLSVRMKQNPGYYKLDGVSPNRDADESLRLVCERDVRLLQENRLVTDEDRFMCTEYGHAMSRYMVQFDTMKLLLSLDKHAKTEQILHLICQASEFKDLRMKPNERPFLREFNKSPLIKYPIKENISTTPQKISLIIQVQLGGVDLPSNKEFMSIRRQFMVDKGIIFERIQRLVRCIIDCKSVDCDGTSTRHALDLARSLAAEYWDHSNLQLRQVPQIGPAASRKLVTHDIHSVDQLADLDTATLERIMSRNPPFGRKMLDSVLGFPRLTLTAEIVGRAVSKGGDNPKVMVKTKLGYTNAKTPVWNGKRPSLTLMAETSEGSLVHFWRGNIQKLDKGWEVKFTVELSGPDDHIKCYVACDEIVGASHSSVIKPDISASEFPAKNLKEPFSENTKFTPQYGKSDAADEFGGDDYDDEEILELAKSADATVSEYGSDDFVDIDELIGTDAAASAENEEEESEDAAEPVQMENGKWACNHHCRGQPLKNGQPCKHRCCREGLDKPRKPPKKKRSGASQLAGGKEDTAEHRDEKSVSTKLSKKLKGQQKLKFGKHDLRNSANLDMIDLVDDDPSSSHGRLSHSDYNIEKSVRLPKKEPKFSYASGQQPNLTFLSELESTADPLGFDDETQEDEFPSPSALFNIPNDTDFPFDRIETDPARIATDTPESPEAARSAFDEPVEPKTPALGVSSSFENGLFDFSAFNDDAGERQVYSSPQMQSSLKRRLLSPAPTQVKCRRVSDMVMIGSNESVSQGDTITCKLDAPQPRSTPAWLDEFDQDLIDGLKGIVEFVD